MKRLFLRWALLNSLTATLLASASILTWHRIVTIESRVGAALILAIFAAAAGYCGLLTWRADALPAPSEHLEPRVSLAKTLIRDAEHVEYASDRLPYLGLIGTMVGVLLLFIGARTSDPHALADHVTAGLATAFVPSIVGAAGHVLLDLQWFWLTRALARVV